MRPRVVADTNIYISAFTAGGKPWQVIDLARVGSIFLFSSSAILEELTRVLRGRKFQWSEGQIQELLASLPCQVIEPGPRKLAVVRDVADNRILECAVAAKARYLVTGDRDLLALTTYFRTTILRPADFLQAIER